MHISMSESQKVTAKIYKSRFLLPEGVRAQAVAPKQQMSHDKERVEDFLQKAYAVAYGKALLGGVMAGLG